MFEERRNNPLQHPLAPNREQSTTSSISPIENRASDTLSPGAEEEKRSADRERDELLRRSEFGPQRSALQQSPQQGVDQAPQKLGLDSINVSGLGHFRGRF